MPKVMGVEIVGKDGLQAEEVIVDRVEGTPNREVEVVHLVEMIQEVVEEIEVEVQEVTQDHVAVALAGAPAVAVVRDANLMAVVEAIRVKALPVQVKADVPN